MIWTVLSLLKKCKRITFEVITFSQIVIFLLLDFKDQVGILHLVGKTELLSLHFVNFDFNVLCKEA